MSRPLRLPEALKRPARAVRDNPAFNRAVTSALRYLPHSLRQRAMWRAPRIGHASARLPNGRTLRMQCETAETVLNALHYEGWTGEEPETLPVWFDLCRNAATVIDVGAHVGHLSLVAALANPRAQVHAFEALPRVAGLLRRNIALNGVSVTVHEMAAGRTAGEASFFASPHGVPSSSGLDPSFIATTGEMEEIRVSVARLDDVIQSPALPVVMKVDTETTEPDVFAGAAELIRTTRPTIIVEVLDVGDVAERLSDELQAIGVPYTPYRLTMAGKVKLDRMAPDPKWKNILLTPR